MRGLYGQRRQEAVNPDDQIALDRKDAARYRFLRDDGHLEYMGPDSNKKLSAKAIDKVVDRWMRMRDKVTQSDAAVKR
jgi:hypothetical protein